MIKKRTSLKSLLLDLLIVVLCLGVFSGSVYLFWKDLNSSTVRTDKDKIATIVFKQKIAQRKFSDRVVWERLQNQSPLYNADTLRTASQSEATITFINNTVIELHENTMLQIFYSEDGEITVNVDGGNIDIDTSSTVEVPVEKRGSLFSRIAGNTPEQKTVKNSVSVQVGKGAKVTLDSGSKLSAGVNQESGVLNYNLMEGNAAVVSDDGGETKIGKGETVKVEKSGAVSKSPLAVTSISNNLRVLNFEKETSVPVQLEWKSSNELSQKPVVIETSRKKDFSVIENKYVVENENNFTLPADEGTLYWRVSVDSEEEISTSGKIRVDNVDSVEPESPVKGSVIDYTKELPKVSFKWQGNDLANNYLIEVSKTADFNETVIQKEVASESAVFTNLPEGNYYWRVTPYYSINNTGYAEPSEVSSFTVNHTSNVAPPTLSVPAQNATLTYQAKDFNLTFLWKSSLKGSDYKLTIAKDETFNSVVYSTEGKDKRIFRNFAEELNPGEYYWKVERYNEEGTAVSEVRHFTVNRYVPGVNRLVYPPENYSVEYSRFANTNFMWKLADEYKNTSVESIIQVSSDEAFNNVIFEQKTKSNNIDKLKLKNGKYFWRIGVYNNFDDKLVYTPSRSFSIIGELQSPIINFPEAAASMVAMKNTPVKISWDTVSDADYYKVSVVEAKKGETVYESTVTASQADDFKLPSAISENLTTYRVFVQAVADETDISPFRQSKTASVNFSVRTPSPVKLVSPSNNTKIDGLSALRKPVVLEWTPELDKPVKTTIIVKRISSSGVAREVKRFDNAKSTASLERLSPGTYQWTVYGSTAEGLPLNAEASNTFVVTPVPRLAGAVLNEPKNNFVIGPEYLRKNRNVSFSWKPVSGATDYTFTLFQRNPDGTVKLIYSEKKIRDTSLRFKNLKALDVGEFEWNVTAYSHAKDGFEEQSSNTVTGRFKISFELPSEVKTNDPGRVYGQ